MEPGDWKFHSVVFDGEAIVIDGVELPWQSWVSLDLGSLEVPHPDYPQQRHELHSYVVEAQDRTVLFCAGELSACVWCFYEPAKGQPSREMGGMTVNERLVRIGLIEVFDAVIAARDERRARDILMATGLRPSQAAETVGAILGKSEA